MPSSSEKRYSDTSPSQYTGAEIATSASPMASLSGSRPARSAAKMPIGRPISSQQIIAPKASDRVAGIRSKICSRTETLFW